MEIDPHTIQAILQKIHQQMRCPQCGKKVPVDLSSLKVMADDALILHVYCEDCNAHIVLQASMQGVAAVSAPPYKQQPLHNASSSLQMDEADLVELRKAIRANGGSFESLFKKEWNGSDGKTELV